MRDLLKILISFALAFGVGYAILEIGRLIGIVRSEDIDTTFITTGLFYIAFLLIFLVPLFIEELFPGLKNIVFDENKDSHSVLTMRYLNSNKYNFYVALTFIMLASLCAIKLGIEGGGFIALFAAPILGHRLLTYIRVKKGYFGNNADEALELIDFLKARKSKNGPTTPFISEDEVKNVISAFAQPAAQAQS